MKYCIFMPCVGQYKDVYCRFGRPHPGEKQQYDQLFTTQTHAYDDMNCRRWGVSYETIETVAATCLKEGLVYLSLPFSSTSLIWLV